MSPFVRRLAAVALALGLCAPAARAADPGPFADWAAVFIAGDYRASTGAPSEVFDNGRREMARAFQDRGFAPENIAQFSVRPDRYPDTRPLPSEPGRISAALQQLTGRTKGGCLFFFTSHGVRSGAVMGEYEVRPAGFDRLLDETCGDRPTVVMISACFSGVFIPELAAPNRMILTAARADRTSFGCGENDVYTFFDQCVLETLPAVATFDALASGTRACVEKRETELMIGPPSEPQVSIGAQLRFLLPLLRLDAEPGQTRAALGP